MGAWIPAVVAAITLVGTIATAVLGGSGRARADVEALKELDAIRVANNGQPFAQAVLDAEKRLLRRIAERYRTPGRLETFAAVALFAGGAVSLMLTGVGLVLALQSQPDLAAAWTVWGLIAGGIAIAGGVTNLKVRPRQ